MRYVSDETWSNLVTSYDAGEHREHFEVAFSNGAAFLAAKDGLRGRVPIRVEWKGPHRPPGYDVVPTDLRIDHVFQVSCKYRSKVMHNAGPSRLFDHCLATEVRSGTDWFDEVARGEYRAYYAAARKAVDIELPPLLSAASSDDRKHLRIALKAAPLPDSVTTRWQDLSAEVATRSAARWNAKLPDLKSRIRMFWRLIRVGDAPYFLLGQRSRDPVRLRVSSAWDWTQSHELRDLAVSARTAGQPEIAWSALVYDREAQVEQDVEGHVEVRWSHGRFSGSPEAKVYLDTPLAATPGYFELL